MALNPDPKFPLPAIDTSGLSYDGEGNADNPYIPDDPDDVVYLTEMDEIPRGGRDQNRLSQIEKALLPKLVPTLGEDIAVTVRKSPIRGQDTYFIGVPKTIGDDVIAQALAGAGFSVGSDSPSGKRLTVRAECYRWELTPDQMAAAIMANYRNTSKPQAEALWKDAADISKLASLIKKRIARRDNGKPVWEDRPGFAGAVIEQVIDAADGNIVKFVIDNLPFDVSRRSLFPESMLNEIKQEGYGNRKIVAVSEQAMRRVCNLKGEKSAQIG